MKRKPFAAIVFWALTALWMIFIFCMSAQSGETSSALSGSLTQELVSVFTPDFQSLSTAEQEALVENWHLIIRKLGHFTEYAVLGTLLLFSLQYSGVSFKLSPPIAWGISMLYAAGDEWHQSFVAGRGPSIVDVGIDAGGAFVAVACISLLHLIIRHRRAQKEKS